MLRRTPVQKKHYSLLDDEDEDKFVVANRRSFSGATRCVCQRAYLRTGALPVQLCIDSFGSHIVAALDNPQAVTRQRQDEQLLQPRIVTDQKAGHQNALVSYLPGKLTLVISY